MPMIPDMRIRTLGIVASLSLLFGLLIATPAAATIAVDTISFPGGKSEFYSPFAGPASIKFTFDGTEADATYNVRIRPAGGTAIHDQDFLVDADDPAGFQIKSFDWPAISTGSARTYVVAVYRGGTQVASESFSLLPPLVKITSASPNPFLPWIDDDFKDETTITYQLLATSQPVIFRIYKANAAGNCCGTKVREFDENNVVEGTRTWVWDGRGDGGGIQAKGDYFVRITATDFAAVTKTSKPFKVSIARTYRVTGTKEKNGIAYHHSGGVTVYRRGGNCFVTKDETDKDLWITCLSARFTVYWRWSLPQGGRIESVSFGLIKVSSNICGATKGHSTTDSFLKVGGVGQFRCRVDKARITYSYPKAS
jgi:hypothetical protein